MNFENEKIKKALVKCKKGIVRAVKEQNKDLLPYIKMINKAVSLAVAEFKCQKCGKEKELQWHHLIERHVKNYVDEWRYLSQRNYWANIIILCNDCHAKVHGFDVKKPLVISEEKILEIKKRYGMENNEL